MGLLADGAHTEVATLLFKLAVPIELIVIDADLLLLLTTGKGAVASTCAVPLLLSWVMWATGVV